MLYKIVIYIYRQLSQDIRKKQAPWILTCKEVDCCTNVNLPTVMMFFDFLSVFLQRRKSRLAEFLEGGSDTFFPLR